jgi:hypothetical protein
MTMIRNYKLLNRWVMIFLMTIAVAVTASVIDEQDRLLPIENRRVSIIDELAGRSDLVSRLSCVSTTDALLSAIRSAKPSIRKVITLCKNSIIYFYEVESISNKNIDLRCESTGCRLDGMGLVSFFTGQNSVLSITGLQIQNGNSNDGEGGAFRFEDSTIKLTKAYFLNNTAPSASGGAVFLIDSTLTFEDYVYFDDNFAFYFGGALYLSGTTLIANKGFSAFQRNSAYLAAAIYFDSASAIMSDVLIEDNIAETVSRTILHRHLSDHEKIFLRLIICFSIPGKQNKSHITKFAFQSTVSLSKVTFSNNQVISVRSRFMLPF